MSGMTAQEAAEAKAREMAAARADRDAAREAEEAERKARNKRAPRDKSAPGLSTLGQAIAGRAAENGNGEGGEPEVDLDV